jgi:hypothetical protein
MQHHRQTRAAMQRSRGLILGRLLTRFRHLCIGGCALTLGTLAITGHVGAAILIVVMLYLVCKALDALTAMATRETACR